MVLQNTEAGKESIPLICIPPFEVPLLRRESIIGKKAHLNNIL